MQDNYKTIEDYCYNVNNVIGKGTYSTVYQGYMVGNEIPVAVKVISIQNINAQILKNLEQEIYILRSMPEHDNIVRIYGIYQTYHSIFVVTELCEGRMKNVRPDQYEHVAAGIINGLKFLRKHNIIHRDIKSDNIIMKGSTPKIIDFGFAKILSHPEERLNDYLGTPLYMAPQVQQGQSYSSKCDIWSFGVLLFEMVFKQLPWFDRCKDRLLIAVMTKPLVFPFQCGYPQLTWLIERCLIHDEALRISWNQLFAAGQKLAMSRKPLHTIECLQPKSMNMTNLSRRVMCSRSPSGNRQKISSIEKYAIEKPVVKPLTGVLSGRSQIVPRDIHQHFINYYM